MTDAWENRVKPFCVISALANPPHTHTFLGTSILIALAIYEKHNVEWAAMETAGGRYDQTRVLDGRHPVDQRGQRPCPHAGAHAVAARHGQGRHRVPGRALHQRRGPGQSRGYVHL
ncbi:MAG: hypothetical protein R2838_03560 [Caldilineaceae bacterium]